MKLKLVIEKWEREREIAFSNPSKQFHLDLTKATRGHLVIYTLFMYIVRPQNEEHQEQCRYGV